NPCGSASRASCPRCQAFHSAAKSSTAGTVSLTDAPTNVLLRDSRLGIHNPEQMVATAYARDDHASSGQVSHHRQPTDQDIDQDLSGCGQPAPGVRCPSRRELLARLQRVDGDQPVAAPERLPGGVREGEVALNDVDDAQVGVPPDGDGPDLVLQAE